MDLITINNIDSIKRNVKDIRNSLEDINDLSIINYTEMDTTTNIILDGTHKYEYVKILRDTDIILPDANYTNKSIKIYFNSFNTYTVNIKYLDKTLKTITCEANKFYSISCDMISILAPWFIKEEVNDYAGDIDIDNLCVWYAAADGAYKTVNTETKKASVPDRIGKNPYIENNADTSYYEKAVQGVGDEETNLFPNLLRKYYMIAMWTDAQSGTAISDHGITLNDFNGDSFTLETYIASSVYLVSANADLLSLGNADGTNSICITNGSAGGVKFKTDTELTDKYTGFPNGKNYHIAVTYLKETATFNVYVNGALVKTVTLDAGITIGNRLLFGCDASKTPNSARMGAINFYDFRIYNKVLDADKILLHYNTLLKGVLE